MYIILGSEFICLGVSFNENTFIIIYLYADGNGKLSDLELLDMANYDINMLCYDLEGIMYDMNNEPNGKL